MALRLFADRRQFFQGELVLYRGDRWAVDFVVADLVGNVQLPVDLTGAAVTAFFPASAGDPIAVSGELVNAPAGRVRAVVPAVQSASAGLDDSAALYLAVSGGNLDGPFTVQMNDESVAIRDRGFEL